MWQWVWIVVAGLCLAGNVGFAIYGFCAMLRWSRLNRVLLNLCVEAHLLRDWPMHHIVDDRVPPRSKRRRPPAGA